MYYASPQRSISVRLAYQTLKADWDTPGPRLPTLANLGVAPGRVRLNLTQLCGNTTCVIKVLNGADLLKFMQ